MPVRSKNNLTRSLMYLGISSALVFSSHSFASNFALASFDALDSRDVEMADLDGDGDMDMVVANFRGPSRVWINENGKFISYQHDISALETNPDVRGIAIGDVNGDSFPDLVFGHAGADKDNQIWLNDGQGRFTDSLVRLSSSLSYEIDLVDIDNDGDLDLLDSIGPGVEVWRNVNGTFNYVNRIAYTNTRGTVNEDFNGDGFIDMVIFRKSGPDIYLTNDGAGNYTEQQQSATTGNTKDMCIGDLNGDGFKDIVVAKSNFSLWMSDGAGSFTEGAQTFGVGVDSCAVGDLDGDGDLDIAYQYNGTLAFWINDGNGIFVQAPTIITRSGTSGAMEISDVNGDGKPDVIVVMAGNKVNQVFLNQGNMLFADSGQNFGVDMNFKGAAVGDVNNDGFPDIAIATSSSYNDTVWLNDGAGSFSKVWSSPITTQSNSVAFYNDGTGYSNLVFGRKASNDNVIFSNNGDNSFTQGQVIPMTKTTNNIAVADFDGDNDLDLMFGTAGSNSPNSLFVNDGTGVFSDSGFSAGNKATDFVHPVDIDLDSDMDVIVEGINGSRYLWVNNGQGDFSLAYEFDGGSASPSDAATGDVNGDGLIDVVFVIDGVSQQAEVFINNGNLTFTLLPQTITSHSTMAVNLFDVDGDGDLDMIEAGGNGALTGDHANRVWFNDGQGNFSDLNSERLGATRSIASFAQDIDGDGDKDLIFVNSTGEDSITVWLNQTITATPPPPPYNCAENTGITVVQCENLVAIYDSTDGPNWTDSATNLWLETENPCEWAGITCWGDRVARFSQIDNGLSGQLPDMSDLEYLVEIAFIDNPNLTGPLPDLTLLPDLVDLYVFGNQISGLLPDFSIMTNLTQAVVHNNQFTGAIPEVSQLTYFVVFGNQLCLSPTVDYAQWIVAVSSYSLCP